jgi:hypothetical protein
MNKNGGIIMKYKVGDKVKVKSLEWYNENKGADNSVNFIDSNGGRYKFIESMSEYCGRIVTICGVNHVDVYYDIVEDHGMCFWIDEMFEHSEGDNKYRLDKSDDDKLATEVTCNDF